MLTLRPQFRLRTLLILVAVVAVLTWTEKTRRRWSYFRQQAAIHAGFQVQSDRKARLIRAELVRQERVILGLRCGYSLRYLGAVRRVAMAKEAESARHARMAEVYRQRW